MPTSPATPNDDSAAGTVRCGGEITQCFQSGLLVIRCDCGNFIASDDWVTVEP